jgi:hypothetical protein
MFYPLLTFCSFLFPQRWQRSQAWLDPPPGVRGSRFQASVHPQRNYTEARIVSVPLIGEIWLDLCEIYGEIWWNMVKKNCWIENGIDGIENWSEVWNLWLIHVDTAKDVKETARIDFCRAALARLSVDACWIAERRCCEQRRTEDKKWLWLLPLINLRVRAVDRWYSTYNQVYTFIQ